MCPFVDRADARCAAHLTLANLGPAFAHCANQYAACLVYHQLVREASVREHLHDETKSAGRLLAAS